MINGSSSRLMTIVFFYSSILYRNMVSCILVDKYFGFCFSHPRFSVAELVNISHEGFFTYTTVLVAVEDVGNCETCSLSFKGQ